MPIDLAARRAPPAALAGLRASALPHAQAREDRFERDVHCLLGLPIDALGMAGAVAAVREAIERRRPCLLATPNVNFVVGARADAAFRDSVLAADLCLADGMPLVWLARLLGIPVRERLAGADLFERLKHAAPRPVAVYFFGGRDGAAEAASRLLNAEGSRLACVGFESPGEGSAETLARRSSLSRINASGADFLVVSLGARKGQAWIERNLPRLAVPVVSHLGAVVNFAAGRVRRAPRWMRETGFEWLWRIFQEAGLLGRYLHDGAVLAYLVAARALPCAWLLRRKPPAEELAAAAVEEHDTGREIVLRLRGAWTRANLAPLRATFARAAAAKRHIRIDLGRVPHVDSAFLGLALLLYGSQQRAGRRLVCAPLSRRLVKLFKYSGADFLAGSGHAGGYKNARRTDEERSSAQAR